MNNKEIFYNTIAPDFDFIVNQYDTNRRIEVIFNDFLGKHNLVNKSVLDAGCGTGWFTKKALERGAKVISLDIGDNLIKITKQKNPHTRGVVGSILELPFVDNSFEYIVSSEVIEHTRDPYLATDELFRILKPNGILCLTVPNKSFWYFSVVLANWLHIRKYRGYENWVYYRAYQKYLQNRNIEIVEYKGIHLYPFVFGVLNGILRKLDKVFEKKLGRFMVNIAVYARKKDIKQL